MTASIVYNATKTAAKFHASRAFVRGLMGPVGPGKTVACVEDLLGIAIQQEPGTDGVRRTRFAVIRNTFPDLKSTTLATWKTWYPEEKFGKIVWDSPIRHHIKFMGADGFKIDMEVLFLPLDTDDDIKKLRSGEYTAIYINEAQYISHPIFLVCKERVNRYPPKILGAPITWTGVIFDTNYPDTDHWIYKKLDSKLPAGHDLIKYKPAVIKIEAPITGVRCEQSTNSTWYTTNPDCDYLDVQNDPQYWINLVPGLTDEEIKVVLMGEYGIITSGKPVHPAYNDHYHFSHKEFLYNPQIELGLGFDFGLTPACAIVQMSPRGQLLVLDEIWSEDMGLREFLEVMLIPHLDQKYAGWRLNYHSEHDPSGGTGSQTDGRSCEDILNDFDIDSYPAASNDSTPRRDGLDFFLKRMADGMPAFSVSILAKMIRKGLMGSYQYAKIKAGGEDRYHEKPLKNMYSHICEGLEYIAMYYAPQLRKPAAAEIKISRIVRGGFYSR